MQFRQDPGSTVFVGIEGRLDSFYKATLEHLGPDNCTILYNEREVSSQPHLLSSTLCHNAYSIMSQNTYSTVSLNTYSTEHQRRTHVTSNVYFIVACMHAVPRC